MFVNSCISAFSQYPLRPLKALQATTFSDFDSSSKQFQSITFPELVLINSNNSNNSNFSSNNSNYSTTTITNNNIITNNNNTNSNNGSSSFSLLLPSAPLPLSAKLNPYGFRQPDCDSTQSTLYEVSKSVQVPTQSAVLHLNGNSKSAPTQLEIPYNNNSFVLSKSVSAPNQFSKALPPLIPIVRNVSPFNNVNVIFRSWISKL